MYKMLSGEYPFDGASIDEIVEKSKKGKLIFSHESFQNISAKAKDLIEKMLVKNMDTRLSALKCL